MWRPLAHALAVLLAGAVTACAAPAARTLDSQLQATRWQLQTATDGQGQPIAALFPTVAGAERHFVLEFAEGRLGIRGGCNAMGGSYQISPDSQLQAGPLMATRKGCEAPLMQADTALSALLAQAWQLRLDQGPPQLLRLRSADGKTLVWTRMPKP